MEIEGPVEKELLPYPFGSPRDILTALFKHKIKMLLIFIMVLMGVGAWVYSSKIFYEAHATLVLKFGREHIFRPEIGNNDEIIRFDERAFVESERKILESRDLARRVVLAMGVKNLYPKKVGSSGKITERRIESATSKLLRNLEVSTSKGTLLIEILFRHERPKVAAQALNLLIEFLKEKHLQVFSDPKSSFLVQRLNNYQIALENTETDLQAFKQKHDLSSPLEDQQSRLLNQRIQLDTKSKTISNELQGLIENIASLESQLKSIPERIPLSTTEEGGPVARAKAELFALKRKEQGLLTKYTKDSVPVKNIQDEIGFVEQFISTQTVSEGNKTVTSGKNPIFHQLEMSRLSALSKVKALRGSNEVVTKQIQGLDEKIQRLDLLREELGGLQRKRDAAEENYKLYVKKVEEARVSEELDQLKMSNISVIQAAEVPRGPAGRPKQQKFLIGAIVGAIMSLGLALVFEYFQGGYARPEQAADDLGLPLLASFSQKR